MQVAEEFGLVIKQAYQMQCRVQVAVYKSTAGMQFGIHLAFEKLKRSLAVANPMVANPMRVDCRE